MTRCHSAVLFALLGVLCFGLSGCQTPDEHDGYAGPSTVETSKGTFTLPSPALADGRELEGRRVNVWNSPERTRIACSVPDGEPLVLARARRHDGEGRYYFELTAMNGCKGWLPERFVRPDPDVKR